MPIDEDEIGKLAHAVGWAYGNDGPHTATPKELGNLKGDLLSCALGNIPTLYYDIAGKALGLIYELEPDWAANLGLAYSTPEGKAAIMLRLHDKLVELYPDDRPRA